MRNSRGPASDGEGFGSPHTAANVRTARIARARALVADPNYPDEKVIKAVARRLANKWDKD